jgi:trehalose 6-phosphate phosphatase
MAIEARPDGITKADAAQAIIAQAARNTVPVFAGDDTTDEDAMRVVKDAHGVTIKIGEGDTVATHRLPTSQALRMLIQDWVKGA